LEGTKLEKAEVGKKGVKLTAAGKDGKPVTVEVERVLVAVGRAPNIEDLGLEEAGVAVERGFIQVNDRLETTAPGVYAVGDVARPRCWRTRRRTRGSRWSSGSRATSMPAWTTATS